MSQSRLIRIQKPLHAILRTTRLTPAQRPRRDLRRHAFFPADVCEVVYG